jgi:ankyrin repeat protein
MKIAFVIGWVFVAIEVLFAASFFFAKGGNDASGKGMAAGFGMVLLPIALLAGALLLWAQLSSSPGLRYAALLAVSLPFLVGGGLWVSNWAEVRRDTHNRKQAGRFPDPRLTRIAAELDQKDYPAAEALLKQSPAIDWTAVDAHGKTLLEHAVNRVLEDYSGDAGVNGVTILLAHGAPLPNAELVQAIFEGNSPGAVALLAAVLQAGVDPNSKDRFGEPFVHLSHVFRGREKLELLAQHGADLHVLSSRTDRPQWNALMTAIYMKSEEPAKFLRQHGVSATYQAPDGQSAEKLMAERPLR